MLEDKIKKLQKHQALQAEVAANQERIIDIKKTGEILIKKNHENSDGIKEVISQVLTAWRELLKELDQRGRGLEEAQDILEFNNQLDKVIFKFADCLFCQRYFCNFMFVFISTLQTI